MTKGRAAFEQTAGSFTGQCGLTGQADND